MVGLFFKDVEYELTALKEAGAHIAGLQRGWMAGSDNGYQPPLWRIIWIALEPHAKLIVLIASGQ